MKKNNIVFSVLFFVLFTVGCIQLYAYDAVAVIDGIYYNLDFDTKNAEVTNCRPKMYTGVIVIPSDITYNEVTYKVTSIESSAFSSCSDMSTIEIPNSVICIGGYAFDHCIGLTSVIIGNSVTSIGNGAFQYCSGLTSITIPNSVTSIGGYAFDECSSLTGVTIPNSVMNIGEAAFNGCSAMTSLIVQEDNQTYDSRNNCNAIIETSTNTLIAGCKNTIIPNNVTNIGSHAFSGCRGLTSIEIPNSVTDIGSYAFWYCSGLTNITIPNSVTSIGGQAFSGCSGLMNIFVASGNTKYDSRNNCNAIIETASNTLIAGCKNTIIPNSVTSIGDYAFYGCSSLTSITIPNSVISIGKYAFWSCNGLTNITIPNSVTSIGDGSFSLCRGLTSVTIGNSVTSIGKYAFGSCKDLTSVTVERKTPVSISSDTFSNRANATLYVPYGCKARYKSSDYWKEFKEIVEMSIDGTESYAVLSNNNTVLTFYYDNQKAARGGMDIGPFNNSNERGWENVASAITSVVFDDSFENYTSLTSTRYWFAFCSSLTSITGLSNLMTENVTDMGCMFEGCSGLTSLGLSALKTDNVRYMDMMFYGCSGLRSLDLSGFNTDNVIYLDNMFYNCSGLTSIDIPNSVTLIGPSAFEGCSSLTSIEIPNSVTSIGGHAFQNCTGLTSINIPNSVTSIGSQAFSGCSNINSITIPNSVVTIGAYAFSGCNELESIIVESGNMVYDSRDNCNAIIRTSDNTLIAGCKKTVIPNSVTAIDVGSFYRCSSLTSIEIPSSVTTIVSWSFSFSGLKSVSIPNSVTKIGWEAFRGCNNLHSVTISSNVTEIEDAVFAQCASLTSVVIPSGVQSIGNNAFDGCSSLNKIHFKGTTPPKTGNNAFYNTKTPITTYVPQSAVNTYKATAPYSDTDIFTIVGSDDLLGVCTTPEISRNGTSNQIIISCATAGASIYYTTNGTMPTENNTQYTGPITVSKNCTIKAIAVKDGYESSSVASYSIDWFKVATPTFGYSNLQLTISTATSDLIDLRLYGEGNRCEG